MERKLSSMRRLKSLRISQHVVPEIWRLKNNFTALSIRRWSGKCSNGSTSFLKIRRHRNVIEFNLKCFCNKEFRVSTMSTIKFNWFQTNPRQIYWIHSLRAWPASCCEGVSAIPVILLSWAPNIIWYPDYFQKHMIYSSQAMLSQVSQIHFQEDKSVKTVIWKNRQPVGL